MDKNEIERLEKHTENCNLDLDECIDCEIYDNLLQKSYERAMSEIIMKNHN